MNLNQFIDNVEARNPGKFQFDQVGDRLVVAYDPEAKGGPRSQTFTLVLDPEESLESFHQRFWNAVFPQGAGP